jgi:hypothetical protein
MLYPASNGHLEIVEFLHEESRTKEIERKLIMNKYIVMISRYIKTPIDLRIFLYYYLTIKTMLIETTSVNFLNDIIKYNNNGITFKKPNNKLLHIARYLKKYGISIIKSEKMVFIDTLSAIALGLNAAPTLGNVVKVAREVTKFKDPRVLLSKTNQCEKFETIESLLDIDHLFDNKQMQENVKEIVYNTLEELLDFDF